MSNSTNLRQIELLVSLMENNPDIANGFTTTREKEEIQTFWKKVEAELNSLGPPIKNITDWKKVWLDKKKYVRGKLAENTKHKKGTGGGPFKEFKFTILEEAIITICSMRESVEGVSNAATFGLPSCLKRKVPNTGNENFTRLVEEILEETATDDQIEQDSSTIGPTTTKSPSTQKKITSQDYLQQELALQKAVSIKVDEAVDLMKTNHQENNQSLKKIYRSIERLYDQQKLVFEETKRHNKECEELKKQKLEDIKRHHSVMENLRTEEIKAKLSFKKALLEIEKEKLQKMV